LTNGALTLRISPYPSRRAYAVDARHADGAELAHRTLELLPKSPIPAGWKPNILVQAHDPAALGSPDPEIQSIRRAQAVLDQDDFVR
jgi:hypothetical protein